MALNSCFNSPTCTSMTEHLGGIASPAEGLSFVPEVFVIRPEYAFVPGLCRRSEGRTAGIFVRDKARDVLSEELKKKVA